MDKEKSKSNRSSQYLKAFYCLDRDEQREARFKKKFGNIREEEVRTEYEEIKFLQEELFIHEPTFDLPNAYDVGNNF